MDTNKWTASEFEATSFDTGTCVYTRKGVIRDRQKAIDELAEWGVFDRCNCAHDCCGHWFVSSYTLSWGMGKTVVTCRMGKNV